MSDKKKCWFDRIVHGEGRVIHFSFEFYTFAQTAQPRHVLGFHCPEMVLSIFYLRNTRCVRSTSGTLENGIHNICSSYTHHYNLMSSSAKCWTFLKLIKLAKVRIQNTMQTVKSSLIVQSTGKGLKGKVVKSYWVREAKL